MVRTYDPKKVVVTVGGVPLSGFADGTFITAARENDAFSKVSGADGIVSRAKSNDKSGSITITLAQTSPANDYLSMLAKRDEETNTGVVPVMVKDFSGRSRYISGFAWVRKQPDGEFGKEISDREWVLDVAHMELFTGGNIA